MTTTHPNGTTFTYCPGYLVMKINGRLERVPAIPRGVIIRYPDGVVRYIKHTWHE